MKKLNFSHFEAKYGKDLHLEALIFVKPLGSKVYRLYDIVKKYRTTDVMDIILDAGVYRKKANVFIFKLTEDQMNGLCLTLAHELSVPCACLMDGDEKQLN